MLGSLAVARDYAQARFYEELAAEGRWRERATIRNLKIVGRA